MAIGTYLCLFVLAATISRITGQCPNGYVHRSETDSCYKLFPLSATWPEAVVLCRTFGTQLARISDQAEQDYIVNYISGLNKTEYPPAVDIWLGASDLLIYGEWIWTDIHQPIGYTNWKPGEPSSTDENCLALAPGANYMWNDAPCTYHANFLCEKEAL